MTQTRQTPLERGLPHLRMVSEHLRDYAGFLSELLRADVEFVDPNFTRVIGTGFYETANDLISGGEIYKHVFDTRRYVVVQNPRKEAICDKCRMRDRCLDKIEIVYPIITAGGVLVGAVGIATTNLNVRTHIIENSSTFLFVINKICMFLAKHLASYSTLERARRKVTELEAKLEEKTAAAEEKSGVRKLADLERDEIEKAINLYGKDTSGKQKAAKALGIGIATLYRKINDEK